MAAKPARPIEVFFSYSHKDQRLRDQLETQLALLKREGLISSWHDRKIGAGEEWAGQIDAHLNTAQIILLLVSADFIASDYCYDIEMKRALERHETGEARVIPIILRRVDWGNAPFGKLQALPKDGKAVGSWLKRDEAFFDIAQGIRNTVKELTNRGKNVSNTTKPRATSTTTALHSLPSTSMQDKTTHQLSKIYYRILIVEDDVDTGKFLKTTLEHVGYNVTFLSDGSEALAYAQKNQFDLLILDLAMGRIGGLEVIKQLRMKGNNIPIIVWTGYHLEERDLISDGFRPGFDSFVWKLSFNLNELLEIIEDKLEKNRPNEV